MNINMATSKKTTPKSRATKGDSSVPLKDEQNKVGSGEARKYVDLPKISADEAEAVTVEILRDAYVDTIRYYLDRKDGKVGEGKPDQTELEQIEGLLKSFEQIIIWFDQSDQWLKDLHEGKFSNSK